MKQFFHRDKIVDSYKLDEFLASYYVGAPICDFLPDISMTDPDLLKWKIWFTQKQTPWVVTSRGRISTLWKLDERLTPVEIDAERGKAGVNWFREGHC